jgi:hypothetical protein
MYQQLASLHSIFNFCMYQLFIVAVTTNSERGVHIYVYYISIKGMNMNVSETRNHGPISGSQKQKQQCIRVEYQHSEGMLKTALS